MDLSGWNISAPEAQVPKDDDDSGFEDPAPDYDEVVGDGVGSNGNLENGNATQKLNDA